MSRSVAGAKVTQTHTSPEFEVGTRHEDENGKEYVYVQADAGGATGAGYVVLVDESYAADMIDTTNSATGFGQIAGVATAAVAASEYCWVQIFGPADIRVAASCAANTAINTTGTAGQLDDDASVGAEVIDGITLTTANGGSAGTAAGFLTYPRVGATL